jgi:type III restriction enzyme
LPEAKKIKYYAVRSEAREPEEVTLTLPSAITASGDDPRWANHLYVDGDGQFPAKFTSWEEDALKAELNPDGTLVAWYRNPTGGERALRVPYEMGDLKKAMYPDFVFFHDTPDGIKPSIVDPHNYSLGDVGLKWRGLGEYAAEHGEKYARIDAVIKDEAKTLLRLDLKDPTIRAALTHANDKDEILKVFKDHGGEY